MRDLIVKCNLMLPDEEFKSARKDIAKQIYCNDGLVLLPPGFELADVDVSLLEQIIKEIQDAFDGPVQLDYYTCDEIVRIINKHIKALKGE